MMKSFTFKIEPEKIRRLKQMALDRGVTIQRLMTTVVDGMLSKSAGPRDPDKYEGRDRVAREKFAADVYNAPHKTTAPTAGLAAPEEDYVAPPKPVRGESSRVKEPATPVARICSQCSNESPLSARECENPDCQATFAIQDGVMLKLSDGTLDDPENWEGV